MSSNRQESDAAFSNENPVTSGKYDSLPDGKGTPRTATRADILDGVVATLPAVPRVKARKIFEQTLEELCETLMRGESVKLRSFGHFNVREKRERIGRNPRTGVEAPITPRRVLSFKASPVLLDRVNGRWPPAGEFEA